MRRLTLTLIAMEIWAIDVAIFMLMVKAGGWWWLGAVVWVYLNVRGLVNRSLADGWGARPTKRAPERGPDDPSIG